MACYARETSVASHRRPSSCDIFCISKRLSIVRYLLCVITVCLLITLPVMTALWRQARIDWVETMPSSQLCVPCEKLQKSGGFSIQQDAKSNIRYCCGETSVMLKGLVEKCSSDRFNKVMGRGPYTYLPECHYERKVNKPMASLVGLLQPDTDADEHTVLQWNTTSPSFIKHGLRYDNGRIFIGKKGYYYVHYRLALNLRTRTSRNTNNGVDSKPNPTKAPNRNTETHNIRDDVISGPEIIRVFVYRLSYRRRKVEMILESAVTKYNIAQGSASTTSNTGALFELEQDDELYVQSSHPGFLVRNGKNSAFGLYMI